MSPRTKEQFEQIKNDKKELIKETALKVFAEEGYHAASISTIAKKAQISKGLIYNYFKSKEDLLNAIFNDGYISKMHILNELKEKPIGKEEMISLLNDTFRLIDENRDYWKLYYMLMLQPKVMAIFEDQVKNEGQEFFNHMTKYFEAIGEEDPAATNMAFLAALDGVGLTYLISPLHFPLESMKKILISKFL